MKEKIAKTNWTMKKGMQMAQNLNDDANEVNPTDNDSHSETGKQDTGKKRVHWSGEQMQDFRHAPCSALPKHGRPK